MFRLLKLFKLKEWLLYALLLVLLVAQVYFVLAIPQRVANVVALVPSANAPKPTTVAVIISCSLLISYVIAFSLIVVATTYLANHITCKFAFYIRHALFVKVNKLSLNQINKFSIPSIIWRATSEVDYLQWLFCQLIVVSITAPGEAFGGLISMLFFKTSSTTSDTGTNFGQTPWQIVALTAAVIVIMTALTLFFAIFVIPHIKKQQKCNDILNMQVREAIKGVRNIRAFDALKFHNNKFKKTSHEVTVHNEVINSIGSLSGQAISFTLSCLTIGIYWMGAWLIQQGKTLSYSTLIGYATLASVIVNGFIGVSVFIMIIPQVRVSINRVNEILNTKVTIADGNEAKQKFVGRGEIEFKNVSFKYGGAKENVLSDISFKANSGDFIGVVGPIGCGKSTLLNLIPRFMDPTSGEIIIDNVNIKNMKLATLREKLGFSLQRANLLNRTVYENIGIGIKGTNVVDATKKIELAADVSQAKPFIEEMEQKYNYMISQNSVNISGGQKQRIVIAQSIANEPEIMLFDDSFSALDYKTDSLVRKEIFAKYKKSTKIIVASRISTIIKANKIIVLNNGNIVDIGTHKQLFSRCEFYRNITLQQMSTEEALRD